MWQTVPRKRTTVYFLILTLCLLSGCKPKHEPYVSPETSLRDNTPVCLVPSAPGTTRYENDIVSIDASNEQDGYLMVAYKGTNENTKLQIVTPEYMTYTYNLSSSEYEAFPLSCGDGKYTLGVYENIEGTQYAAVFSQDIDVKITNPLHPFLYPNQYVKFNADSNVTSMGKELASTAHDDLEVIQNIYNYVIANITYDDHKAETVQSGYIPNVDEILDIKTGICLDYAALMTSMLRSQQIPTRMEIGYAGQCYHAWISIYVDKMGWMNGMIQFDGQNWSLVDPTYAANAGEEKAKNFIGDGDNYVTKFIY